MALDSSAAFVARAVEIGIDAVESTPTRSLHSAAHINRVQVMKEFSSNILKIFWAHDQLKEMPRTTVASSLNLMLLH